MNLRHADSHAGSLRMLVLALTASAVLAGCAPHVRPDPIVKGAAHATQSSRRGLERVLAPGLGIPCAGRAAERHFNAAHARLCVQRLRESYLHHIRGGLEHP